MVCEMLAELVYLDNRTFGYFNNKEKLNRMLSLRTCLEVGCVENDGLRLSREIGKGQCGRVWSVGGSTYTFKAAHPNKIGQTYNNFVRHYQVRQAFELTLWEFKKNINIPELGTWREPSSGFVNCWNADLCNFHDDFQPSYGFFSERILPLHAPIREAIFDVFAPKSIQGDKQAFLARPESQDCLIRLYLGRRNVRRPVFQLRNFGLTVDEMESLGLDTAEYARTMATALAVLHWKADIDANDVEFVLGRSPVRKMLAALKDYEAVDPAQAGKFAQDRMDHLQESVGVWLLDFDQCQKIPKGDDGTKQLESAFFFNDPYYPRPAAKDPRDQVLWTIFRDVYLSASAKLTGQGNSTRPLDFIEAVEREDAKRVSGGSLFQQR